MEQCALGSGLSPEQFQDNLDFLGTVSRSLETLKNLEKTSEEHARKSLLGCGSLPSPGSQEKPPGKRGIQRIETSRGLNLVCVLLSALSVT